MKKTFLLSICSAIFVILVSGCTSTITSDGAQKIVQPSTFNDDYKAEFQPKDTRVKGNAQINVLFGILSWGANGVAENSNLSSFSFQPSSANFAKSAAVYEACQRNNADTLIGTRYVLTTTDYIVFKIVKCEVAGYPATMTGVKKLKPFVLRGKDADTIIYLDEAPQVIK
ncbi:MAG: hypothetical protein PHS31_10020 [Victivallaceae bacterium]|nr:hypothetical protein [Victivallaceae bacterium]